MIRGGAGSSGMSRLSSQNHTNRSSNNVSSLDALSRLSNDSAEHHRGRTPPPPYSAHESSYFDDTMAHPARASSLNQGNNDIYRFTGASRSALDRTNSLDSESDDESRYPKTIFDQNHDDTEKNYNAFPSPSADSHTNVAYPFPQNGDSGNQKPLISYVKNDWKNSPRYSWDLDQDDDICPEGWMDILCSRACKRYILIYLVLMVVAWISWFGYYGPAYVKYSYLQESLKARFDGDYGYFGMNRRVQFAGMKHLERLDRKLVPGSEVKGVEGRRLVVVGDIHGCVDECKCFHLFL
jgi:hypothetical protein